MIATMPLNWFTDLRVNTHLIYDDNTLLPVFEKGEPVLGTDGKQRGAHGAVQGTARCKFCV